MNSYTTSSHDQGGTMRLKLFIGDDSISIKKVIQLAA